MDIKNSISFRYSFKNIDDCMSLLSEIQTFRYSWFGGKPSFLDKDTNFSLDRLLLEIYPNKKIVRFVDYQNGDIFLDSVFYKKGDLSEYLGNHSFYRAFRIKTVNNGISILKKLNELGYTLNKEESLWIYRTLENRFHENHFFVDYYPTVSVLLNEKTRTAIIKPIDVFSYEKDFTKMHFLLESLNKYKLGILNLNIEKDNKTLDIIMIGALDL